MRKLESDQFSAIRDICSYKWIEKVFIDSHNKLNGGKTMKQDETFKEKTESINPKKGIPQEADQEDASLTDQETENISGGLRPHILQIGRAHV